jgi:hypothetical protein
MFFFSNQQGLLNNKSENDVKKIVSFSKLNNHVIAIIKTLAEWDYEID